MTLKLYYVQEQGCIQIYTLLPPAHDSSAQDRRFVLFAVASSLSAAARRRDTLPDRILYILVVVGYKSQSWSLCQYVNVSQIHIFIYISAFIVIVSPIHRSIH